MSVAPRGAPEYWIVDQLQEKVTLLRLAADGKYREVRPRKGILKSRVLPGFWLKTAWLWQQPLPRKADVLARILGEALGGETCGRRELSGVLPRRADCGQKGRGSEQR